RRRAFSATGREQERRSGSDGERARRAGTGPLHINSPLVDTAPPRWDAILTLPTKAPAVTPARLRNDYNRITAHRGHISRLLALTSTRSATNASGSTSPGHMMENTAVSPATSVTSAWSASALGCTLSTKIVRSRTRPVAVTVTRYPPAIFAAWAR